MSRPSLCLTNANYMPENIHHITKAKMQMYITGTERPTLELPGANKPVLVGQKEQKGLSIEMAEGLHPISRMFCLQ